MSTVSHDVIARLRLLTPVRPLTLSEAYALSELHANRLLELQGVRKPGPVDLLWIRDLPRVRIIPRPRHEMPTLAGFTQWEDGQYKIYINRNSNLGRRRFTLAHEFGHVITWNGRKVIYSRLGGGDSEKHDRQLGDLGQVDELPPVARAPHLVRLADRGAQREALEHG